MWSGLKLPDEIDERAAEKMSSAVRSIHNSTLEKSISLYTRGCPSTGEATPQDRISGISSLKVKRKEQSFEDNNIYIWKGKINGWREEWRNPFMPNWKILSLADVEVPDTTCSPFFILLFHQLWVFVFFFTIVILLLWSSNILVSFPFDLVFILSSRGQWKSTANMVVAKALSNKNTTP